MLKEYYFRVCPDSVGCVIKAINYRVYSPKGTLIATVTKRSIAEDMCKDYNSGRRTPITQKGMDN